jgi:hypothetical protein
VGVRYRKRAGNKNSWINLTASSRGPKASLSLSNGATSGLRFGWNSSAGLSASIPGTGIYWRQNKGRSAAERRHVKEEKKREAQQQARKEAKQAAKSLKKDLEADFGQRMQELLERILVDWTAVRDIGFDPFSEPNIAAAAAKVDQAFKVNSGLAEIVEALEAIEGVIQNDFHVDAFTKIYRARVTSALHDAITGVRVVKKKGGGRTFYQKVKIDWNALTPKVEFALIGEGLPKSSFEIFREQGSSTIVVEVNHFSSVHTEFHESLIQAISLLVKLAYSHLASEYLLQSSSSQELAHFIGNKNSVDKTRIRNLRSLAYGRVRPMKGHIKGEFPGIFSVYGRRLDVSLPAELMLIARALHGSLFERTKGWRGLFRRWSPVPAEVVEKRLGASLDKIRELGFAGLADESKAAAEAGDTSPLKQEVANLGAYDEFVIQSRERVAKMNKGLVPLERQLDQLYPRVELLRKIASFTRFIGLSFKGSIQALEDKIAKISSGANLLRNQIGYMQETSGTFTEEWGWSARVEAELEVSWRDRLTNIFRSKEASIRARHRKRVQDAMKQMDYLQRKLPAPAS